MDDSNRNDETSSMRATHFFTTTDVINSINSSIRKTAGYDSNTTGFQLQRRFENGSTRPATDAETKAANLDAQLQQAATFIATLKTRNERIEWANRQREYGNDVYKSGDYEKSIDIYLTCLVVTTESSLTLFYKVMNNLAQCALQLSWYSKAVEFCDKAIKEGVGEKVTELSGDIDTNDDDDEVELQIQQSKLYFKRGKANRLRGEYKDSLNDLETSILIIESLPPQQRDVVVDAIEKEKVLLAHAKNRGKQNHQRHQQAMKNVLGTKTRKSDSSASGVSEQPLYSFNNTCRQYSSLKATSDDNEDEDNEQDLGTLERAWYYYLYIAGRIAQRILDVIDDNQVIKSKKYKES